MSPHDKPDPPRLLFADEDAACCELAREYAGSEAVKLLVAETSNEALEIIERQKPAIVMASATLPGIRGPELCSRARSARAPQPTYAVLLVPREGSKKGINISTAGVDEFMLSPFNRDEFFARLRSALRIVRVEGELVESQNHLLRAEKLASLGVMAGGIAHEFNNIFGAILGYCELALEHGDAERMRKALNVTLESAERATSITRNLLGFAREQPPHIGPVELDRSIDRVLAIVGPGLRKRDIRVELNLQDVGMVQGDAAHLEQVIFNVVQNAQHAMEKGGVLTVALGTGSGRGRARLTISDTGIGMTEEQLDRVFEPFYTTKGAYGRGKTQGTGLGLSVVHGIVRAHGGKISIESTPGQGTSVMVDLPLSQGRARPGSGDHIEAMARMISEAPASRRLNVLAVDDEPRILEVLSDMLETMGHGIDTAASVDEAVEKFKRGNYDLVFTDVVMPGRDGWELREELIALRPDVQMVFVTGSIGDNTRRNVKRIGALGCIYKPFRMEDVRKVLGAFCRRFARTVTRLRLPAKLNRENCDALSDALLPRLASSRRDLELDLRDVGYLSSYAVGFLLKVYSQLNADKRRLTLSNVCEHVFEVLELTGLAGGELEGLAVHRRVYGEG